MPISNLSVTAKYLPPLPLGGHYLSGYGALQNQFPLVHDVYFLLNYYGKITLLISHRCSSSAWKTRIVSSYDVECVYACQGTSLSYQLDVLSMSDVLLASSTHTVNPVTTRFPDVSHVTQLFVLF